MPTGTSFKMSTSPPSSEGKAQIETGDCGPKLRNRSSKQGSEKVQKEKETGFSPLIIHIVTGRGSLFWPFGSHNGDIKLTLFDDKNEPLTDNKVTVSEDRRFKLGEIYSFKVPKNKLRNPQHPPKTVSKIEVFNDYEESRLWQWHLDNIVVENTESCSVSVFPYRGWIRAGATETIGADVKPTELPGAGKDRKELEKRKGIYQYRKEGGKATIPAQVQKLPKPETFTYLQRILIFLRLWFNRKRKFQVKGMEEMKKILQESWKSLCDLLTVYGLEKVTLSFPPVHKKKTWMDDVHFGYQRVNGLNHSLIALCKELPASLQVTDDEMKDHLNGMSLQEAMNDNRLFVVNLQMLKDIPSRLKLCAPIGLFFSDHDDELLPVAIQLEHDGPTFLPEKNNIMKWHLAKLWFNNADAIYHQSVAHLGLTHLLMEGVAVATNRQLSSGHPVYKLLKPHFLYMMAINELARTHLLGKGKYIDTTLNTGAAGTLALIAKVVQDWRMDEDGTLPVSLTNRGLLQSEVLPSYHYREDAMVLYNAIKKYVTEYVNLYYDTPKKLAEDEEIQAWAAELARDRDSEEGGCGIQGVPGFTSKRTENHGKLETVDQLVTILTSVIFTCSVEHAAVNFAQYEEYGYPINYPSLLNGDPPGPRHNGEYKIEDIFEALPNPMETLDIMVITDVLSQKYTNSLGDFETVYFTEDKPLACLTAFKATLQEIHRDIISKNNIRRSHYYHLDPLRIPNAISI